MTRIGIGITQDGMQMWERCLTQVDRGRRRRWFGESDKKAHGHGKHRVLQPPHLKRPFDIPRPLLMNYRKMMLRWAQRSSEVRGMAWQGKARSLSTVGEKERKRKRESSCFAFPAIRPLKLPKKHAPRGKQYNGSSLQYAALSTAQEQWTPGLTRA